LLPYALHVDAHGSFTCVLGGEEHGTLLVGCEYAPTSALLTGGILAAHQADGVTGIASARGERVSAPGADGFDLAGFAHGGFSLVVVAAQRQAVTDLAPPVIGFLQGAVGVVGGAGQAKLSHAVQEG